MRMARSAGHRPDRGQLGRPWWAPAAPAVSPRRPSCASAPLESTIRRPLLRCPRARPSSRGCPSCRPDRAGGRPPDQRAGRRPRGWTTPRRDAGKRVAGHGDTLVGGAVAGAGTLVLADREMSTSHGSLPPPPDLRGRRRRGWTGAAVLRRGDGERARPRSTAWPPRASSRSGPTPAPAPSGSGAGDLPVVDGRPVADLVDAVLRTGRAETVRGPAGQRRPVGDGRRPAHARRRRPGRPARPRVRGRRDRRLDLAQAPPDVVEQAQLSLLPPSLPLLPDVRLSGSYHRAAVGRRRRRRLVRRRRRWAAAGSPWWSATPSATACRRPAR